MNDCAISYGRAITNAQCREGSLSTEKATTLNDTVGGEARDIGDISVNRRRACSGSSPFVEMDFLGFHFHY